MTCPDICQSSGGEFAELCDFLVQKITCSHDAISFDPEADGRLLHELHQMEGLFPDDDGNIAAAMSEAEAFIYPVREVTERLGDRPSFF